MNGYGGGRGMDPEEEDMRGWIWRLPVVKSKELGRLGPGFGYGTGCGFGIGFGLLGGFGVGAGIPGLQLGAGVGAGCGIGVGFGYGFGRGTAYDENQKYSNVGKFFHGTGGLPSQEEISSLMNKTIAHTKRLMKVASKKQD